MWRERFRRLRKRWAIPGWAIVGGSLAYNALDAWSNSEFALSKLQEYAVIDFFLSVPGVMVLGFAWLTVIVFWPGKDADSADRLTAMKRLSLEAAIAARERAKTDSLGDTRAAAEEAYFVIETIPTFLDRAFIVSPRSAYLAHINTDRAKRGDSAKPSESAAVFLEWLALRTRPEDLDEAFFLPAKFEHYLNSSESWPTASS